MLDTLSSEKSKMELSLLPAIYYLCGYAAEHS